MRRDLVKAHELFDHETKLPINLQTYASRQKHFATLSPFTCSS